MDFLIWYLFCTTQSTSELLTCATFVLIQLPPLNPLLCLHSGPLLDHQSHPMDYLILLASSKPSFLVIIIPVNISLPSWAASMTISCPAWWHYELHLLLPWLAFQIQQIPPKLCSVTFIRLKHLQSSHHCFDKSETSQPGSPLSVFYFKIKKTPDKPTKPSQTLVHYLQLEKSSHASPLEALLIIKSPHCSLIFLSHHHQVRSLSGFSSHLFSSF